MILKILPEWTVWDYESYFIDDEGTEIIDPTFTLISIEDDTEWTIIGAPEDQEKTDRKKFKKTYVETWDSGIVTNGSRTCLVTVNRAADIPAPTCDDGNGNIYDDGDIQQSTETIDAVQIAREIDDTKTEEIASEEIDNPKLC